MATKDTIPLWAKIGQRNEAGVPLQWHSLEDHSADVAAVFEALLRVPTIARRLAALAHVSELDPIWISRLAIYAYLHDFGKANRGFQRRWSAGAPIIGHITPAVALVQSERWQAQLFSALPFEDMYNWGADADAFLSVLAHHGRPVDAAPTDSFDEQWRPGPDGDPIANLACLGHAVRLHWREAFSAGGSSLPVAGPFWHAISGLMMLADWIGSDTGNFPLSNGQQTDPKTDRMSWARKRAPEILRSIGFDPHKTRDAIGRSVTFQNISPWNPRPAQEAIGVVDGRTVIFESETGSGKTEAALYRFARLFAAGDVDGLYFALPTRVAATSMFERVKETARRLFPENARPPVILAVPGYARADDATPQMLPGFEVLWDDDPDERLRQERWAAERPKRFLAGTISVGTIDQALLGAIQVKHAHMRSACLMRHLLVVDEVHASDAYMEQLLLHLLKLHRAAGGHALLLSATLGAAARTRLLHGGRSQQTPKLGDAEALPYPALSTDCSPDPVQLLGTQNEKRIAIVLESCIGAPDAVAHIALDAARQGAKVLVVRNLHRDAVATADALFAIAPDDPALFRCKGVPTLHHGRFAREDREFLDAAVQSELGRDRPPGGKIVIGSTTLQISLDIDADLIITDLCPADVLLQRLGRLHRHGERKDRPADFAAPRAIILCPNDLSRHLGNDRIDRHGLGGAHGPYTDLLAIEATRRLIVAYPTWVIPAMNRLLVERTTHPEAIDALANELAHSDANWRQSELTTEGRRLMAQQIAKFAGIPWDMSFFGLQFPNNEENIATRLGTRDLSVTFEAPLPVGPFGKPIRSLSIPDFWLRKKVDTQAELAINPARDIVPQLQPAQGSESFRFTIQGFDFNYGSKGLART